MRSKLFTEKMKNREYLDELTERLRGDLSIIGDVWQDRMVPRILLIETKKVDDEEFEKINFGTTPVDGDEIIDGEEEWVVYDLDDDEQLVYLVDESNRSGCMVKGSLQVISCDGGCHRVLPASHLLMKDHDLDNPDAQALCNSCKAKKEK